MSRMYIGNRNLENHLSFDEIKNAKFALLKCVQKLCLSNKTKSCYISLQTTVDARFYELVGATKTVR